MNALTNYRRSVFHLVAPDLPYDINFLTEIDVQLIEETESSILYYLPKNCMLKIYRKSPIPDMLFPLSTGEIENNNPIYYEVEGIIPLDNYQRICYVLFLFDVPFNISLPFGSKIQKICSLFPDTDRLEPMIRSCLLSYLCSRKNYESLQDLFTKLDTNLSVFTNPNPVTILNHISEQNDPLVIRLLHPWIQELQN